jgi:hypothetical protein
MRGEWARGPGTSDVRSKMFVAADWGWKARTVAVTLASSGSFDFVRRKVRAGLRSG